MKTLIHLLFALAILSCKEDDDGLNPNDPNTKGCLTGINSHGDRVFIRCCTKSQFLAGSNTNHGGTSTWSYYSGHKWEPVNDCGECK